MEICKECGATLKHGIRFCPECGKAIEFSSEQKVVRQNATLQKEESPKKVAPTCTNCGKKLEPGTMFCGECGQKIDQRTLDVLNQKNNQKDTEKAPNKRLKYKAILIVIVFFIICLIFIRPSDHRKDVYNLIPEIIKTETGGFAYGEPVYPKYGSKKIEIIDLDYTYTYEGYTFDMYQVNGIVTAPTLLGTTVDWTYEMKIGIDKNFDKNGIYYYSIEDGSLFW